MQGDYVGLRQQRVQIHIFACVALQLRTLERVVCQDFHSECLGDLACILSDPAKADDTHVLASQLNKRIFPEAPVRIACPLACFYSVRVLADMVAQLQQKSDGELRNSGCSVCRNVGYRDPFLLCGSYIHDVVACCQNANELHAGAGVHCLFCDRSLVCVDYLCIPDALHYIFSLCAVIHRHLAKSFHSLPGNISRVQCVTV